MKERPSTFPDFSKCPTSLSRRLPFHADFVCGNVEPFQQNHPLHKTLGPVRVELINHNSPVRIRVQIDRAFAVIQKIRFGASGTDGRRDRFARHNVEGRNQTQRAMTPVFKFDPFLLARSPLFLGAMRSSA